MWENLDWGRYQKLFRRYPAEEHACFYSVQRVSERPPVGTILKLVSRARSAGVHLK